MTDKLPNVTEYFESKYFEYNSKKNLFEKLIKRFSFYRIFTFLLTVLLIFLFSGKEWVFVLITTLAGFSLFIFLMIRQTEYIRSKKLFDNLESIIKTELDLLYRKETNKPDGLQFFSNDHPYAADLDIFGKKSLFQLIDRCATKPGMIKLAERLTVPIKDKTRLTERQAAIIELNARPEWRQYFQAVGKLSEDNVEFVKEITDWTKTREKTFMNRFVKTMLFVNPLLGFLILLLIFNGTLHFGAFLLFLIIPFSIIIPKLNFINRQHSLIGRKTDILKKYAELCKLLETETYNSILMNRHKKQLASVHSSAASEIKALSAISASFDYRLNLLVGLVLNIFFLWDIIQCLRLEKWKNRVGDQLQGWFDSLAETDELCSFAGFAFAHPDSVYTEITDSEFELTVLDIKHPFIDPEKCIGNDLAIHGFGKFRIITGANMAGKSTFLRTIGINLVLAMTGSPVLAAKFRFTPVDLFTGIKTSDSLQEGESYFFAELKRLKEIIDFLEMGGKNFVILDEILRGTNSTDKQKGSMALVKQLLKLKSSGLIATHDLALGNLEEVFPGNILNNRFEVEIKDNELYFDYKLKEGISQNLNATFLMKKMGITL